MIQNDHGKQIQQIQQINRILIIKRIIKKAKAHPKKAAPKLGRESDKNYIFFGRLCLDLELDLDLDRDFRFPLVELDLLLTSTGAHLRGASNIV